MKGNLRIRVVAMTALLFAIFLGWSCKENNSFSAENLDETSTRELVFQVLLNKQDEYIETEIKCVAETSQFTMHMFRKGTFKNFVKEELAIKDTIHLNSQIKNSANFKVTKELFPGWNIISEEKFRLYQVSSSKKSIWESLGIDCPRGYLSISKPIFNESFDTALMAVGLTCGRLCGGGETRIYKLKEGKWKIDKVVGSWVY